MKKKIPFKTYILLLLLQLVLPLGAAAGDSGNELFGSISPYDYLTGRFDPVKSGLFVRLDELKIPCGGTVQYLRREAAVSLKRMIIDFRKAHPKSPVWVRSSTRTWHDQRSIWEEKWFGRRPVEGRNLSRVRDHRQRALLILRYSSMPGTSRHHWGTDVDFNNLTDGYFTDGEGRDLYLWLRANAAKYGFHQPYCEGRSSGYEEEKWHWSYLPLSKRFLDAWNLVVPSKKLPAGGEPFAGAASVWDLAKGYANAIGEDCR